MSGAPTEFKTAIDQVQNTDNNTNLKNELHAFLSNPANRNKMRSGNTDQEKLATAVQVAKEMTKIPENQKTGLKDAVAENMKTMTVTIDTNKVSCADILAGKRKQGQSEILNKLSDEDKKIHKTAAALVSLHYMIEKGKPLMYENAQEYAKQFCKPTNTGTTTETEKPAGSATTPKTAEESNETNSQMPTYHSNGNLVLDGATYIPTTTVDKTDKSIVYLKDGRNYKYIVSGGKPMMKEITEDAPAAPTDTEAAEVKAVADKTAPAAPTAADAKVAPAGPGAETKVEATTLEKTGTGTTATSETKEKDNTTKKENKTEKKLDREQSDLVDVVTDTAPAQSRIDLATKQATKKAFDDLLNNKNNKNLDKNVTTTITNSSKNLDKDIKNAQKDKKLIDDTEQKTKTEKALANFEQANTKYTDNAIDTQTQTMATTLVDNQQKIAIQQTNFDQTKKTVDATTDAINVKQSELEKSLNINDKLQLYANKQALIQQQKQLTQAQNNLTRFKTQAVSAHYKDHSKLIDGLITPIDKQITVYTDIQKNLQKQFTTYQDEIATISTDYNALNDTALTGEQAVGLLTKYLGNQTINIPKNTSDEIKISLATQILGPILTAQSAEKTMEASKIYTQLTGNDTSIIKNAITSPGSAQKMFTENMSNSGDVTGGFNKKLSDLQASKTKLEAEKTNLDAASTYTLGLGRQEIHQTVYRDAYQALQTDATQYLTLKNASDKDRLYRNVFAVITKTSVPKSITEAGQTWNIEADQTDKNLYTVKNVSDTSEFKIKKTNPTDFQIDGKDYTNSETATLAKQFPVQEKTLATNITTSLNSAYQIPGEATPFGLNQLNGTTITLDKIITTNKNRKEGAIILPDSGKGDTLPSLESNQTGLHVQNINDLNTKGDPLCDLVDNTDASKSNPFEDFEITNPYIAVSGNIQEHSQTIDQLATIITAPQNSKKDPKKEKQQQAKKVYDKATNPQAEKKEGGNKVNENSAVTELKSQIKQNEEQIEKLSTTLLESPKDTQAIVNQIEELVDKNEKLNKQLEKELLKPSSSSD